MASCLHDSAQETNTSVWGVTDSPVSPTPHTGVNGEDSEGGMEKSNELGFSISWERGDFGGEDGLDILQGKQRI